MPTNTGIVNSQRRLYRVTYTPLSVPVDHENPDLLQRASFLRALGLTKSEAQTLGKHDGSLVSDLKNLSQARTEAEYSAALKDLRNAKAPSIADISVRLGALREERISNLTGLITEIDRNYQVGLHNPAVPARVHDTPLATASLAAEPSASLGAAVADPVIHPLVESHIGSPVAARFPKAVSWAVAHRPDLTAKLKAHLEDENVAADDLVSATNLVLPELLRRRLIATRVTELVRQRLFDVVGLLHFERLVMTPLETERGELLYTLPLAPKEVVTLAHKEWSIHEEEYTRYIQDYLENYSETGVAQTTELAKATETQNRRQDATSANLTSMSAQPVNITAPVSAAGGSVIEAASSVEESVTQTKTMTAKATSRTIQDHRVSFTVNTVKGTQDFTARLLRNPHSDRSIIVDYYRRMRQWKNELFRYGVRLTYDIVVPHPGRRVLARYNRLRELDAELLLGFQSSLTPGSITTDNWTSLAASYRVPLPPPPPDQLVEDSRSINYPVAAMHVEDLQLSVPPGYQLKSLGFDINVSLFEAGGLRAVEMLIGPGAWGYGSETAKSVQTGEVNVGLNGIPLLGPVKATIVAENVFWGKARLFAQVTPTIATLETWRRQCWQILREIQLAQYQEEQDRLRAKRVVLQRAIDAADTLSLRRIEREHIMLACLEWLFPFLKLENGWFGDVGDTPTDFDRVMGLQASVLIKLMHTAIDWDSMLVTLLPFFWEQSDEQGGIFVDPSDPYRLVIRASRVGNVFVDHPDPLHREFLRAGAARVVLPIQPGYEEDMLSLFDLGLVGPLGESHRYTSILKSVQDAHQRYQAQTHPAGATLEDGSLNPQFEGDYPLEGGKLIGRWHETTPTGALDMDVTSRAIVAL